MKKWVILLCALFAFPMMAFASGGTDGYHIAGIPLEFIFFGLTLIGIAIFHHHTLRVALIGLVVTSVYKIVTQDFNIGHHFDEESTIIINLLGLLMGFEILAHLFESTHIPRIIPKFLPHNWMGPFLLLVIIFLLSAFLDNIAAALIGGSIAHVVFRGKVHIGYLAAIVASSNGGGSGSVLGDTTTTMMWIDGVAWYDVTHAYAAAIPGFLIYGIIGAIIQHRYHPMLKGSYDMPKIDYKKLLVVILILVGAVYANIRYDFPSAGVWIAIILGGLITKIEWDALQKAVPGAVFLCSLVFLASMMPVQDLPGASWESTLVLGFISSVFDNIPLTKLALDQGGYDWGVLAYAVGFGGSMIWFGSSAGVALSNMYPETRSVALWVKNGWFIIVGYLVGFTILMLTLGWHPHAPHKNTDTIQTETPHSNP